MTSPLAPLHDAHRQFLALVEGTRPELHRYCARMVGSVIDAEDVVQETLTHAFYELSQLRELPAMRTWLFRIAHRRALDHLRRPRREAPLEEAPEPATEVMGADDALAHQEEVHLAVSRFAALPPAQRACVALKDVLGLSLEECAEALELTVPAVKAALHRGRLRLRSSSPATAATPDQASPVIARYAALFDARDWDGVRALLVDDVKLEVVARETRSGKARVGHYFSNYAAAGDDWAAVPAWLDGREVVAVYRSRRDVRPSYAIVLEVRGAGVSGIRDFRHLPYFGRDAAFAGRSVG